MKYWPFIVILSVTGCDFRDPIQPEPTAWEYDRPSKHGMNEASLLMINDSIEFGAYGFVHSLLIVKDGTIVYENHYPDVNGRTEWRRQEPLGRLTLMVTGMAFGLALDEGLIDSLATPIHLLLPQYAPIFDADPQKKEITLEDLLLHKTGFSWNEELVGYASSANDINRIKGHADWTRFVLEKPLEAPPGLRYGYNSGSGLILANIISHLTGQDLSTYVEERIFSPLGIVDWHWGNDPQGTTNGATGLSMGMHDIARLASVYLNDGRWGNRIILDRNWVLESVETQYVFSVNFTDLGYLWWKFSDGFRPNQILRVNDGYFFPNEDGKHVYIVPHQNMIITIGAENPFYGFYNPSLLLYFDVLRSVQSP